MQVANEKEIAKRSFDVQKKDFGERSTVFRRSFIAKEFEQCLICRKCKVLFE